MSSEMQPAIYRFKLGGFEITSILDGKAYRKGLYPSFGPERAAIEAQELCAANFIDASRYIHPFILTLVKTGRELVLFDTGNGFLCRDYPQLRGTLDDGHLVERLGQMGYKPEDIDVVVTTHGHPDHIGGLTDRGKPVFPKA